MNSTAVKMLLALSLAINLCACDKPTTTSNTANSNNSTNGNAATGSSTSTAPVNSSETSNSSNTNTTGPSITEPQTNSEATKPTLPTLEEVQKELQARKLAGGKPTPKPTRKPMTSQAPPPVEINQDRELVRYYLYLVTRLGLPFNQPIEMPGGASLFNANDIIQFTMVAPKVAVVAAKFADSDKQIKGTEVLNKLNIEGRNVVTVGNYVIMVKGADEDLMKVLTKALKDFPKKP